MDFDQYQRGAKETALYPFALSERGLRYSALGLASEAGEVCGACKRIIRDDEGRLTMGRAAEIATELGDVLWYVAAVATDAGLSLDDIARINLGKLRARAVRGTIKGKGSER